ncbi:MAG: glycine zipper 2TM domain-containing protein [Granulosicoccus sp.]
MDPLFSQGSAPRVYGSFQRDGNVTRNPAGVNMKQQLKIRKVVTVASLIGIILGTSSMATASDRRVATERFTEYAKVIDVKPVYKEIRLREPRQECWTEQQEHIVGYETSGHNTYGGHRRNGGSNGSALVGSVIGGVIGNQLGRGHSRSSRAGATVAGAIIGGAIGSEARGDIKRHRRAERSTRHTQSRPIYETRPVERCKRVVESRSEQRLQHYNVTYRYKGRIFTTRLPRDPGNRLELQVSVAPARR